MVESHFVEDMSHGIAIVLNKVYNMGENNVWCISPK